VRREAEAQEQERAHELARRRHEVVLRRPAVASVAGVVVVEGEGGLGIFWDAGEREREKRRNRAGLRGVCFGWNRWAVARLKRLTSSATKKGHKKWVSLATGFKE